MPTGGRFDLVPIDEIDLDTSNPRIAHFLSFHEPPHTPDRIRLALSTIGDDEGGTGSNFSKLRQSIQTNRGIVHPVVLADNGNGRFRCVEGNTRVLLYRIFQQDRTAGQWNRIPSLIHSDLSEDDVHAIRLQAHLVGPRPWDAYSKAKYLYHLRNDESFPYGQLVDFCGGNKKAVIESINAYEDMEAYYRPIAGDADFDIRRFSGFIELQKPGIKGAIRDAGYTLDDFARWIHEEKIERLADVRRIPAVLKDKHAHAIFLEESIDTAIQVLERPKLDEAIREADLSTLCSAVAEAIHKLSWAESERLRQDPTSANAQYMLEAHESLGRLITSLELE